MQAGTRSQLQLAAVCSKQAAAVCSKQAATVCSKQAATKSKKSNLHTKNAHAATMPQLAVAAKPHACCLFAAIHCEKPFISIRVIIRPFRTGNQRIKQVIPVPCSPRRKAIHIGFFNTMVSLLVTERVLLRKAFCRF